MPRATGGLRVAVVGLQFGLEFVPIYRDHPWVDSVSVADPRASVRAAASTDFGILGVYESLDAVLADDDIDAVHIVTGMGDRADHVVAALEAGKHVASTVPMALSFEDIQRIIDAQACAERTYMMMETAVFTREYLFAEQLVQSGSLGKINYARGTHFQDMTNWPAYWMGLPPMFYATHAIAPILRLLDVSAVKAIAIGGGSLAPENRGAYGNDFAIESALVQLEGRATVVELTRSLFQVARPETESFSIFGDSCGFEWPQREESQPLLHTMDEPSPGRGRHVRTKPVIVPDRAELLPEPIRRYTQRTSGANHSSLVQGGGHGGSHPHLVHEFVSSVITNRAPAVDHKRAANWTAVGIAAHASAILGGEPVTIPRF
jgi:predicted dehydrogenase